MIHWILGAALLSMTATAAAQDAPFAAFDMAGPAVLNDPHDLALGPDGRIYVADKFAGRIAVLDPDTLDVVEEIGAGQIAGVHDVHFGAGGEAVVAATGLGAVLIFDQLRDAGDRPRIGLPAPGVEGAMIHSNGRIYAMAGGAGALVAFENDQPVRIADGHFGAHDVVEGPDGSVWVADNFQRRLVRYSPDLVQRQIIEHPKFGFVGPRYMDFDEAGRLVVADQDAHRILLIDPDGSPKGVLLGVLGDGSPGIGPGKFDDPEGVLVDGPYYYFADSDNNRIVRYVVVVN